MRFPDLFTCLIQYNDKVDTLRIQWILINGVQGYQVEKMITLKTTTNRRHDLINRKIY